MPELSSYAYLHGKQREGNHVCCAGPALRNSTANADGLRWGYSYTRSQFTKAIDVLKREAAIGFIPEHVESEFQDLAETIAKTLVFPVND